MNVLAEEGAAERVSVVTVDVLSEPPPGSYDVAVVKSLLQTLSPGDALIALKNIGEAITPGGAIYIIGSILDDSRTSPQPSVAFNLTLISVYDVGESYTEQLHRDWLMEAGFTDIKRAPPLQDGRSGLMTARKPG